MLGETFIVQLKKLTDMKYLMTLFIATLYFQVLAQNVGINTSAPHSSSALEIFGTDKGFLMPRLFLSERNAIAQPAEGLMIYNLTDSCFSYFDGIVWRNLSDTSALATTTTTSVSDSVEGITVMFEYGDTISVGDAVAVGDGISCYRHAFGGGADYLGTGPGAEFAQTFRTSSKARFISAVHILVDHHNYSVFEMSLRHVSNGEPVGGDINGEVSSYNIGAAGTRYVRRFRLAFDNPVPVEPDSTYALIFKGSSGAFYRSLFDTYAEGNIVASYDSGATWTSWLDQDLWFEAFEVITEQGSVYPTEPGIGLGAVLAPPFIGNSQYPATSTPGDIMKNFVGIALEDGLPGEMHLVQISGVYSGFSGLSVGSLCRLGFVPGSTTMSGSYQIIGMSIDTNKVLLRPEY